MSIIIPVYKTERYLPALRASLEKAIAKVENAGIELIFQEDAKGEGVSRTRNAAIERATGEWIGFVDSDDLVSEDWFAAAAKAIEANPDADIVHMGNGKGIARTTEGTEARKRSLGIYARDGYSWLNFVRKEFLGGTRYSEKLRMKEDNLFFLELARRIDKLVECDVRGYFYRMREGSAIHVPRRIGEAETFLSEALAIERRWEESGVDMREVRRGFGRLLGWDFVHWARERGEKDSEYRRLWREAVKKGEIDVGGAMPWWRPGLRWWLMTDGLWLHRVVYWARMMLA